MKECGLTRIPYYPELNVLDRKNVPGDKVSLILSVLLYWHSLESHQRFNARNHSRQLERNLRIKPTELQSALDFLTDLKILKHESVTFKTQSQNPDKSFKTDDFYELDFHELKSCLKSRGINIPIKILRLASDDGFDFYSYLSPLRLPLVQGLEGMIKSDVYDKCALMAASLLCEISGNPKYEEFCAQALAPGWRILVQPPAKPQEVAARWQRQGERSIDIDLTDGAFFMPDGTCFGQERHHIWHCSKRLPPRILASALYLGCTALSPDVEFYSDLNISELKEAFLILHDTCGLKGRLGALYFDYLDLQDQERKQARSQYEDLLNDLDQ